MRSTADVKNSIRAINDTSKITKAMKLIATSKMKKAIARYDANLLYFNRVRSAIKDILVHSHELRHTFLEKHQQGNPAYIVIAADKGLCGGYNHNILNFAHDFMSDGDKFVITIGQEARAFFERKGVPIDVEYLHISQNPTLYEARNLASDLATLYKSGEMNEVYLIYTRYFSSVKQVPTALKLLPVELDEFDDIETELDYDNEMNYYPSPKKVFDILVPQYIIGLIYGALIQAFASENSARMMAMDASSKNADEMLGKLEIEMNRARQAAITMEITEIVGAMDALT
ncbi:ATP synthase gamma chain [Christensenellaceae bacterium]|nr:ATP synthase gamma chain [Christensenellaceae bacterium]BDF61085.1 ATP synthase gamma chain [Christensenellaceae bacterium]